MQGFHNTETKSITSSLSGGVFTHAKASDALFTHPVKAVSQADGTADGDWLLICDAETVTFAFLSFALLSELNCPLIHCESDTLEITDVAVSPPTPETGIVLSDLIP